MTFPPPYFSLFHLWHVFPLSQIEIHKQKKICLLSHFFLLRSIRAESKGEGGMGWVHATEELSGGEKATRRQG